ncbi:MAG: hypothetical protein VX663_06460 [Pseudomonadota bacterium]|nr:hypothetical protein [Pseudomonadota bacterium]
MSRVLGQDSAELVLSRYSQLRDVACAMVRQARATVEIVSRDLDPQIYDNDPFAEALRGLVTGDSRRAAVRILLLQPQIAMTRGSRLIDLAQRLPSFISIHTPGEAHRDFNQAMLLVDRSGYLHRDQADQIEATASFAAAPRANELGRLFDEIWDHSTPDQQSRRLGL